MGIDLKVLDVGITTLIMETHIEKKWEMAFKLRLYGGLWGLGF